MMIDADHPSPENLALGPILSALADPMRRRVVADLARAPDGTERTCSSFGLPVTKATRTHHFRVLREAGLIRQIDRGNCHMTSLRRADIEMCFPGLLSLILRDDNK